MIGAVLHSIVWDGNKVQVLHRSAFLRDCAAAAYAPR